MNGLANKLTLNVKKSNYVIFRPRQKRIPFIPQIKIFNPTLNTRVILEMKDFVKYLGIMIDSELSWKHHIDFICHKISRSVGIIAKMRHYIPRHLLLNLYHALIAPYLNYGICLWGNNPQTYLNKILVAICRTKNCKLYVSLNKYIVVVVVLAGTELKSECVYCRYHWD